MVIKHTAFKHGWWYFYRVHTQKTEGLADKFPELKQYLSDRFISCPNEYFEVEPRSSKLRFSLSNLKITHIPNHEVATLARLGLQANESRFASNHSKVQVFMLENDANTIAMEIPLWLHHDELQHYEKIFACKTPLTGHIDLLRIEDGKIWIWDYKPNANFEKYATTQVYFYAYMLSKRTGIPLDQFRCGYFDAINTYVFDPNTCKVTEPEQKRLLQKIF